MGGVWSGQRMWKKPVVEGPLALDTADLRRLGVLVPGTADRTGTLSWGLGTGCESAVGYALTVGATDGTLRLQYSLCEPAGRFDYPVRLVTTPCHLGGARWWFVCPLSADGVACGRRVRKLYLRGKWFGCRRCHDLTYTSCQESDGRIYALARRGLNPIQLHQIEGMSVGQLALAMKVLTFEQKRLDRLGRRMDRIGLRRNSKGKAGDTRGPTTTEGMP